MYNYNNQEGGIGPFIRDLVIKLIFVIILVLLLIWLFPMPNMQPFYDRIYTENITLMKDTAKNYYTTERLPVAVNDKVTMTLGDMVDKHLMLNLIDKNGNTCSTSKSYVEVTKLDTEYALKVYLSCGDEYDYIIEYIGCHDVCTDCTAAEVAVATPLTATVTKTVAKTNTVVNTDPTPVVTPVVTKETQTWDTYSKASTTTISGWSSTIPTASTTTSNGITTTIAQYDTDSDSTEDYDRESAWVYAAMYIRETSLDSSLYDVGQRVTFPGTRVLRLDYVGVSDEAQDLDEDELDLEVSEGSYYTSSDYSNYIANRKKALVLDGGCEGACSLDMTASEMKNASLTSSYFSIVSNSIDYDGDDYILDTVIRIKSDISNVSSHYDEDLGYEVVYIPVKFKVTWNEPTKDITYTYRYITTVSYANQEVLKGSAAEAALIANGYTFVSARTVTL